jgi:uncharacterized membrane protein
MSGAAPSVSDVGVNSVFRRNADFSDEHAPPNTWTLVVLAVNELFLMCGFLAFLNIETLGARQHNRMVNALWLTVCHFNGTFVT